MSIFNAIGLTNTLVFIQKTADRMKIDVVSNIFFKELYNIQGIGKRAVVYLNPDPKQQASGK